MYKNLILSLLILSVIKVIYGQNFIPGPRIGQLAVSIGDRIYYIGGMGYNRFTNSNSSNFFYSEANKWVDLTSQGVNLPIFVGNIANIGGANQDLIFIIGDVGSGNKEQYEIFQLDTKANTLTTPLIQGKIPPDRNLISINSVSYKGKIYVPGVFTVDDVPYNSVDILDTINLSWGIGSLEGAPLLRFAHTVTLVDEIIYYIGGIQTGAEKTDMASMEKVR
jgi:hypothetical protein